MKATEFLRLPIEERRKILEEQSAAILITEEDLAMRSEVQATHWTGCWREPRHHGCAIRKIEELLKENRELSDANEAHRQREERLEEWIRGIS